MATDKDICNITLNLLGVEEIASLNEVSRAANVCKIAYSITKEALLRSHFWNFALKRATLTPEVTPPSFGYANSFALPADAVVWRFVDLNITVKQEGRKLLSDSSSIQIIYVSNAVAETDFDPLFTLCLAYNIGMTVGYKLTNNSSLVEECKKNFKETLAEARRMNAISQTPDGLVIDVFTGVRQ